MNFLTVGLSGFSNVTAAIKAFKYINKARLWLLRGNQAARFTGKLKSFTKRNFRHNLKVRTGLDPPSDIHAHHVFPKELSSDFATRGINVHDPKFGAWWAQHDHLSAHRNGYNNRWQTFLTQNPTAEQIYQRGREFAREYGFEIGF